WGRRSPTPSRTATWWRSAAADTSATWNGRPRSTPRSSNSSTRTDGTAVLRDDSLTRRRIRPGTVRRILPYALRHRWPLAALLAAAAVDAVITAANPLILKALIDDGITPGRLPVVVWLSLSIAGLALVDAAAVFVQTWFSGRVGQGLVYDLRTA